MKWIPYGVVGTHLLIAFSLFLFKPLPKKEMKPIKIKTIVQHLPPPPKEIAVAKSSPPPPRPAAPKKAPPPKAPQVKKVATPPKKVAPKPAVKKTTPPKQPPIPQNLLTQLQESIAKIEENSHKGKVEKLHDLPQEPIKLEMGERGEENTFAKVLVHCLQTSLDLPEKGAVKIELTLKNDGTFVTMKVLKSQSERNRLFLEEELPLVKYPSFTGSLKNEKERPFVITFCNS